MSSNFDPAVQPKAKDPRTDGLTANETNPDTTGVFAPVLPEFQANSILIPTTTSRQRFFRSSE